MLKGKSFKKLVHQKSMDREAGGFQLSDFQRPSRHRRISSITLTNDSSPMNYKNEDKSASLKDFSTEYFKVGHLFKRIMASQASESSDAGTDVESRRSLSKPECKITTEVYKSRPMQKIFDPHSKVIRGITKDQFLEFATHDQDAYEEYNCIMLHSYPYIVSEYELFEFLLRRFCLQPPVNMSLQEKKAINNTILLKIQAKVVVTITKWFKFYEHVLYKEKEIKELFVELLYLIHTSAGSTEWLDSHFIAMLESIENSSSNPNLQPLDALPDTKTFSSIADFFIPVKDIRSYDHIIAKQLCIYDSENFATIKITELMHKKCHIPS